MIGAWQLVETAVRAPGAGWDRRPVPQGGLFVFTQRHYSYFLALWKRLGFAVIGTVPEGFRHRDFGYVDLLIMYRRL